VRVGGVLVSSHPSHPQDEAPFFATDGVIGPQARTSSLEDGELHELPARSSYVWRWGGSGPLELSLAVRGAIELDLDGQSQRVESEEGRYRLVRVAHNGDVEEIAVHTADEGATVTDLSVWARA
jgi:hypothetical protein